MTLSSSVENSLREAESSLRNALAFAARNEKSVIAKRIADLILEIDQIILTDKIIDELESNDDNTFNKLFKQK